MLFTDDVHAWELYKLRILNAGHSCMAYLCALAGITFVDEAMATPEVHGFVSRLLYDEAVPALSPIPGYPRAEYAATVLDRFANPGVRDQIARLCIDGTAKFPTFLVPTIEHHLETRRTDPSCRTRPRRMGALSGDDVPSTQQAADSLRRPLS